MSWRRYSEAMLQLTPVSFTTKNFKVTSNARNEAMFKEATEFAQSIKILERDMKQLLKNIDVHFKNLRCILVSPLPRIYDEGPNGVQPLDEEARLLGANMEVEGIPRAAEEARRRIQAEVLDPLHEWMNIYRQIMERMKVLEALRLELDSRRRTVGNLQGKLERVRSTLGTTRHKGEAEMRETQDIMVRKQEKMDTTGQKYMDTERMVYNSLYTLVRDTAVLRDYTHCCLNIMQEAFSSAAKAYDTMPTVQQSTNKAVAFMPPESKYEAQLPTAERATPKGIGGLFDRLRGRSKVPQSPASRGDQDIHQDQHPRYGGYPAYNDRFSPYGSQPSSMRPTNEQDGPAPYMQQNTGSQTQMASGYPVAANPYMPEHRANTTMPYQQQNTGGNYQPQVTGGYAPAQPASKYAVNQPGGNYMPQVAAQRAYSDMPSAPSHQVSGRGTQDAGVSRYAMSGQSMPQMVGPASAGQDWTQNGY